MRLSQKEIEAIRTVTKSVFGQEAEAGLFGSRTDDSLRGGDIDLFIQCKRTISRSELYTLKMKFLIQLKKIIGEQKIDVLIEGQAIEQGFLQKVKSERILL
jgi:uncharacterized protein